MATNPLLLTVMALVHTYYGRLPDDRADLYGQCVDLLLWRWEDRKAGRAAKEIEPGLLERLGEPRVRRQDVEAAMNELAYRAHAAGGQGQGPADIPRSMLVEVLEPVVGLKRLEVFEQYARERSGLLLERGEAHGKPVYAFPHRTFQEYLAAGHLAAASEVGERACELAAQGDHWREVIRLATERLARQGERERPLSMAQALCLAQTAAGTPNWGAAILAGEVLLALGEATAVRTAGGRQVWRSSQERLVALVEGGHLSVRERARAGNVLGALSDIRDLDALVEVPAGEFWLGEGREAHKLALPAFRIGKYPVTNAQFARFLDADGYETRRYWTEDGWAWRQGTYDSQAGDWLKDWLANRPAERRDRPFYWDDGELSTPSRPVVGVSWFEAVAYGRWLTEVWRAEGRLGASEEFRLPTEAEWEKAARGGLEILDAATGKPIPNPEPQREYPWSSKWDEDLCNTTEGGIGTTTPVGIYSGGASPYGCLDMAGNVWEWTASLYGKYPYPLDSSREAPNAPGSRVLRGGSWSSFQRLARCASRRSAPPAHFNDNNGFRVVLGPSLSQSS